MFDESDLLPLSGLQHLAFCERQWGLIHLEQLWMENILTAEGRVMHERAHSGKVERRGKTCIVRSMKLRSLRLGLVGEADVVELNQACLPKDSALFSPAEGVSVHGLPGKWHLRPVEYKRGRPKSSECDLIQLCAQALCLEEMFDCSITEGDLYYGETQRRTTIIFDDQLRKETQYKIQYMHKLFDTKVTPKGSYTKKCKSCSFYDICRPEKIQMARSATRFLDVEIQKSNKEIS